MLWLYICVFRIGTVASRETGGKGSKAIKECGSGMFLEERIVDLCRELMCIFLNKANYQEPGFFAPMSPLIALWDDLLI